MDEFYELGVASLHSILNILYTSLDLRSTVEYCNGLVTSARGPGLESVFY